MVNLTNHHATDLSFMVLFFECLPAGTEPNTIQLQFYGQDHLDIVRAYVPATKDEYGYFSLTSQLQSFRSVEDCLKSYEDRSTIVVTF